MRLSVVVVVGALLACSSKVPPGTFDLDAGGPFVEARAIRAIQKEPVLAIHNISKKDGPPHFVWGYDFRRWGWGSATLTNLSHSGPEVFQFDLADPIQRPCDGAFLAEKLVPVSDASSEPTWRLEGGPLGGELLRKARGERCVLQVASQKWAEANAWKL